MMLRLLKLGISILYLMHKRLVLPIVCTQSCRRPAVVLTYHAVKSGLRHRFERHMDELVKMACPISADRPISFAYDKRYIAVTFDDGFTSVIDNALSVLVARKIPATIFIPTGYIGKRPGWITNPQHEYADETVLTEEQIRLLPNDLISIGSHSVNHPHLARIGNDRAITELIDSKKKLEEILKTEVSLLSLPYGSFNEEVAAMSKETGYKRVFLNIPKAPFTKDGDYVVGRIHVSLDDWLIEFRLKILGAYQWLPFAIAIKRKIISIVKPAEEQL
jgi:peptidoglycan/xylan/chitin deacetylase (PgdA/CDA1 family)